MVQNLLGLEGWNHRPAKESSTLKAQEECLEDCELYHTSMHSAHSSKFQLQECDGRLGAYGNF